MNVDGKKIAEDIYTRAREQVLVCAHTPVLTIITCDPNFETKKYLALKEKKAQSIGVKTIVIELTAENTTDDFVATVREVVPSSDGIIVQLPLPKSIDVEVVLASIPETHDVDGLNPQGTTKLTPVVGACKEILSRHDVDVREKFVTIIGSGRLVGLPAYNWFQTMGAHVSVVTRDTQEIAHYTKNADIIVCGAGVPGLLTPDMIKEGVVILDAGTSEDGGELKGDADPRCAEKASLFTPVPGGIGPLTIAILLQNVVTASLQKYENVV